MDDKYTPGIGIAAGSLMLRWELISQNLPQKDTSKDTANVFINFECVLKNLATYHGLGELITYHKQDVVLEIESAIINLVAHYKGYFVTRYRKVNVYLYYTDLTSELPQEMRVYNKFYRSLYLNKYLMNPAFRDMSSLLVSVIIPEVDLILNYIPGCYFLRCKGFDSSVAPYLCSQIYQRNHEDETIDNIVISGDVFDTQYLFMGGFKMIYIKRRFQHFAVYSDISGVINSIVKDESPFDLAIFNGEMYFRLLLSIKGSKIRNIKSAKGFGYGKFMNLLKVGLDNGVVLTGFESIRSIADLFPEKYRDDIINSFQCTNLDVQIEMTTEADIESLKSQLVDKSDIGSVQSLNNKRFLSYPLKLMYLI